MFGDNSLDDALLRIIHDPTEWDFDQGCSMGRAYELTEGGGGDAYDVACRLISAGHAYVGVPLSCMDYGTILMPVTWELGHTTYTEIIALFGAPHLDKSSDLGRAIIYDLCAEEGDAESCAPPKPHSSRNLECEGDAGGRSFPFERLLPSEALKTEFRFDVEGTLQWFEFRVGPRQP